MLFRLYPYILFLLSLYSPLVFAFSIDATTGLTGFLVKLYTVGFYQTFVDMFTSFFVELTYLVFSLSAFFFDLAIDVVKQLYKELGISQYVATMFDALPVDVRNGFLYFRVPDCIHNILAGVWIRQMRAFIPFF